MASGRIVLRCAAGTAGAGGLVHCDGARPSYWTSRRWLSAARRRDSQVCFATIPSIRCSDRARPQPVDRRHPAPRTASFWTIGWRILFATAVGILERRLVDRRRVVGAARHYMEDGLRGAS